MHVRDATARVDIDKCQFLELPQELPSLRATNFHTDIIEGPERLDL